MKTILLGLLAAALCSSCATHKSATRTRYMCTCGPKCSSCSQVSYTPGNCECGKPRKADAAP